VILYINYIEYIIIFNYFFYSYALFCYIFQWQDDKSDMSDTLNTVIMETSYAESENSLKVGSSPILNVARQDSGVPEDLASPLNGEEDPDLTMNSECNITVIHITESQSNKTSDKSLTENKDSKDGSDSGVEGCATEVPRVSFNVKFYL
jgi:hypothetical protein